MTGSTRTRIVASLVGLALLGDLPACRRAESPAGPSPTKARPKPPKGAIVPSLGLPLPARVTLRIEAATGLRSPRGVTVDRNGNVYVADTGNGRIVKFDSSGRELSSFGTKGTGPGEFVEAWTPVVSPQGDILVLDRESTWISVFTADGRFKRRFAGPGMGLYFPGGLATAADGSLFLADTGMNRIVRLNPDGVRQAGDIKALAGITLKQPTEVATDPRGDLYVYQTAEKDTPSLLFHIPPGQPQTIWLIADAPSTRDSPRCAVGRDRRVYLTDPDKGRILGYSPDGETYQVLQIEGLPARALQHPAGIAIDEAGRLYAVDTEAGVIYRIELVSTG